MNMPIQAVAVPLFDDGQGGLRVTGTRVLLERIVHAFEDGATPEGIVQSYDTLKLADVYAVLTWYLRHKAEVEDYLRKRAEEAEAFRQMIEAKQPDRAELRARLEGAPNQALQPTGAASSVAPDSTSPEAASAAEI